MFKLLKKKDLSPPDIGKEEGDSLEQEQIDEDNDSPFNFSNGEGLNKKKKKSSVNKRIKENNGEEIMVDSDLNTLLESNKFPERKDDFLDQKNYLNIEKISAKIEVLNSLINALNERFSLMNQQLGEVRATTVANEKNLSLSNLEAKKVIEIVKELDPGKLSENYQKINLKVESVNEKLNSYSEFLNSMVEEIKAIKRKANLFEGADALFRLSSDVKKDLIEIQKINNKVRMNADKSEQIFIELNKRAKQEDNIKETMINLENSFAELSKKVQEISLSKDQIVDVLDFNNFKDKINLKLEGIQKILSELSDSKNKTDKLANSIEKIVSMEKKNEEDITFVTKVRYDSIEKQIKDIQKRMDSTLEILEQMAIEISRIKKNKKIDKIPFSESSIPLNNKVEQSNQGKALVSEDEIKLLLEEMDNKLEKQEKSFNPLEQKEVSINSQKGYPAPEKNKKLGNEFFPSKELDRPFAFEGGVKDNNIPAQIEKSPFKIKSQIEILIQEGEKSLLENKIIQSIDTYQKILNLYDSIKDNDLNLYYKIMGFYNNLLRVLSLSPEFNKSFSGNFFKKI